MTQQEIKALHERMLRLAMSDDGLMARIMMEAPGSDKGED